MTSESVELAELFDTCRFPPASLPLVLIVLYFPVGVILAILRIFIGFHAYIVTWLLPKYSHIRSVVLRVMCMVCGLCVIQDNTAASRQQKCKVLVSNYTSPIDRLAIEILFPCAMPSVWDLPSTVMWLLGYEDMGAKEGREVLIQRARRHCQVSSCPLLAFPEGATTNGRVGLLKYSVWPFSLGEPIQPVTIQIKRPLPVSPSVVGSSWWSDLLWFLFTPYSTFCVRVLPVEHLASSETVQQFARRVQQTMATSLNIQATSFTAADKHDLVKQHTRQQCVRTSATTPTGATPGCQVDVMVQQVQNVLPDIAADIIRRDLDVTHDVDTTINNILEGRLAPSHSTHSDGISPASVPLTGSSETTTPVTFGRTTTERHLTFGERKKQLLETARQRYLDKHAV